MKRLMIMGAGYTQIPLIETAKRMGCHTIAASIPGDYPGLAAADEVALVDIADPDAVVEKAKEMNVDAVTTCGLDLGMASIGAVAEALHLPGPSRRAAALASNKLQMKKALVKHGVQTARFVCIHEKRELKSELSGFSFPVILKAVDQMGSRGIFRCDTADEVWENYDKTMAATKKDYCLLEEFIEGEIFGVEARVQHQKVLYMLPNNIEAFVSATPTPIGHSVPFRESDTLGEQIEEQTRKAVQALGLDDCPVNCDFIKKDGKVYVIELTGRSGATGLSEMVSIYYGMNYYESIVRLALGEPVGRFFQDGVPHTANLTRTLLSDRKGILRKIYNYNLPSDDIIDLSFNKTAGDEVKPYRNGRDRIGQLILKGDSLASCELREREILSHISLDLEGDIPLYDTVIHPVSDFGGNHVYVKREDTLPFSFGGNKVRFAKYYLDDMERHGADALIIYGNYHSNLCRILSAAAYRRGIPCSMVYNMDDVDDSETSYNSYLIHAMRVKEFHCHKSEISGAVDQAKEDFTARGYRPYYIYGNSFGKGNEWVPMQAYADVWQDLCAYEKRENLKFDYIFLASSTNMTQSGLLAGQLAGREQDQKKCRIVGISVSRNKHRAKEVTVENLKAYSERIGIVFPPQTESEIFVTDEYLDGGYGCFRENILDTIRSAYEEDGLNLDGIYTGKAFYGMKEYLKSHEIIGKNVLFIHTGGTPLFFDELADLYPEKDKG